MKRDPNISSIYKDLYASMCAPEDLKGKVLDMANRQEIKESLYKTLRKPWYKRHAAIVAFAAMVILGAALTFAAVTANWKGLPEMLEVKEDELQNYLEQGVAADFQDQEEDLSVTADGVTITPDMVFTDGKMAYLSFIVEGYDLEEGAIPAFSPGRVIALPSQGEEFFSFTNTYNFYNDVIMVGEGEKRTAIYRDGSEPQTRPDGSPLAHYENADGNLELIMKLMSTNDLGEDRSIEEPSFFGKRLHIELRGLQTYAGSEWINVIEGPWTFELTLPDGSEAQVKQEFPVHTPSENADYMIDSICLSPISIEINYSSLESEENSRIREPVHIQLEGIVCKDGTILRNIAPILTGIANGTSQQDQFGLDHVVNPEQVEAILIRFYNLSKTDEPTFTPEERIDLR